MHVILHSINSLDGHIASSFPFAVQQLVAQHVHSSNFSGGYRGVAMGSVKLPLKESTPLISYN